MWYRRIKEILIEIKRELEEIRRRLLLGDKSFG
jgi:hypothetical protein